MDQLFTLPEEYEALRESVRALADKKIQPFAHDVDANARFPQEAFMPCRALVWLRHMYQRNLAVKALMRSQ